jgi:NAD(P)-dependent dehydrogenase (short-subunit alcohol dehydrogenase family)
MGLCDGRVVVVTGAARGIGRAHALALAAAGAKVVVNDLGVAADGSGAAGGPAQSVVNEILAAGGEAVADRHDVADWEAAGDMICGAIEAFGDLHAVVHNAGFVRDRMFVSTSPQEWDAVVRVHLNGHFAPARHACTYWRGQSKAGKQVNARLINTSSGAGLLGSVGQSSYSAAKAAIAGLTLVQAAELGRYGITANAIAPAARTRMTEGPFAAMMAPPDDGFDVFDPANIAPLVVWLCSPDSGGVTGRVFEVQGGQLSVNDGWRPAATVDKGARWDPEELGDVVHQLCADAVTPLKPYGAK